MARDVETCKVPPRIIRHHLLKRDACMPSPSSDFAVPLPLAMPGMRIGLLGGSFNPPHDGHLLISRIAMRRLRLDQVWWLVSPGNPLKSHDELAPLDERLAAARRLAAMPQIIVTDLERHLTSTYTIDTLRFLKRRSPGVQFVWLMGADNLVQMPRWRRWRDIVRLMPMAVVDRPGFHLAANASRASRTFARSRVQPEMAARMVGARPPRWSLLTGPLSAQSSTAIRRTRRP